MSTPESFEPVRELDEDFLQRLKSWMRQHWAVVLPIVPIVVAVIRILMESQGDDATFRVLLSTVNVVTLLLGTIVPSAPFIVILFLAWLWGGEVSRPRELLDRVVAGLLTGRNSRDGFAVPAACRWLGVGRSRHYVL